MSKNFTVQSYGKKKRCTNENSEANKRKHISTVAVTLLTLDEVTKWLSWLGDQSRPWILERWAEMNCMGWDVLRLSHTRMSQS